MSSGGGKQTVGYRYHIGFRVVLSHGPVDGFRRILYDGREVWSGDLTSSGSIDVDKPDLMGGEGREGGIVGRFTVTFGDAAQTANAYLQGVLGGAVPAFRKRLSVIAEQIYYGTNPYLKDFSWQPQRALSREVNWYDAKAVVGDGHMNPAHMIVDAITSKAYGAGRPLSVIDDAAFRAAADTLHAEGFGLSLLWTFGRTPDAVPKFLQLVLDHIGGVIYPDPRTGLIRLVLLRADYSVPALPLYDDSNARVAEYDEAQIGDTVNEVVLTYTAPDSDQPRTISAQNIGNVNAQGRVVSRAVDYPGIADDDLALRVLDRDLRALSTPLGTARLEVNRSGWDLSPGAVIRVSSARLGITEGVFRVVEVEESGIADQPTLSARVVQDVFGLGAGSYVVRQPTQWVDPVVTVTDITQVILQEIPYYHLATNLSPADLAALSPDYGLLQAFPARDHQSWMSFDIHYSPDGVTYGPEPVSLGAGTFAPVMQLAAPIGPMAVGVSFSSIIDGQLVSVGNYGVLIEGAVEEMVEITAWDPGAATATLKRSVMDSVPHAFSTAAKLWITSFAGGFDNTEHTDGETAWYKLLPRNRDGVLPLASATGRSITFANRGSRPYPPGNVRINGQYFPVAFTGNPLITIDWAHRDRVLQTAGLTAWTTGNIGPEPGTTYNLRLYGETDSLLRTEAGLTGVTYEWVDEDADSGLTIPGAGVTFNEDTFDTDSTASYTQFADTAGTWAISGGELVATGGTQDVFIRDGFSYTDVAIEADINHAENGGLVLRFVDNANYYLMILHDDSGAVPSKNIRLYKRLAGSFTELINADIAWARGTSKRIRFQAAGTTLTALVDGVEVWSASDSSHAGPGGVGMRNHAGQQTKFQAFRWNIQGTPSARLNGRIRAELESLRDGLTSRQIHNITVDRAGWGYNWGKYWGGL